MRHLRTFLLFLTAIAFGSIAYGQAVIYEAGLTGDQETPPNNSPGFGVASIRLNSTHTLLTFRLDYSDLMGTTTEAHIHLAPGGVSGPIVYTLENSPFPSGATGSVEFNPEHFADLEHELFYVNIHTSAFPGGEIRGQICSIPVPNQKTSWGRIRAIYR